MECIGLHVVWRWRENRSARNLRPNRMGSRAGLRRSCARNRGCRVVVVAGQAVVHLQLRRYRERRTGDCEVTLFSAFGEMMKTPNISVIHTSPVTVDVFGRLLRERIRDARVSNILDDSILPQLRDNDGDIAAVMPRWRDYARIARDLGADVILNACSSIGELCDPVGQDLGIRIVRVDARMAREAVARGRRVAVVATLASTLRPTRDLVVDTARREGRETEVTA